MLSNILKNSKLNKHNYFPFITLMTKKNKKIIDNNCHTQINSKIDNTTKNFILSQDDKNKPKSFLDIPDGTYIH